MLYQPALMSDVCKEGGNFVVVPYDNYMIRICDPGEYQVLVLTYDVKRTPALAAFTHPNMIRSRTREEEIKHKQHDWRLHTIASHVFVVPRDQIELLAVPKVYTYPRIRIGGQEIIVSTSGGSNGIVTTDYIHTVQSTPGPDKAGLLAIAKADVRGTSFEPFLFHDEIEEAFYAEHGGDMLVYSAINHGEGMVKATACIGGYRFGPYPKKERIFMVPADDYDTRGNLPFVVEPLKYQEVISDQSR